MKTFLSILFVSVICFSCGSKKNIITEIDTTNISSNYKTQLTKTSTEKELEFWQQRTTANNYDAVSLTKYAQTLLQRFKLKANISDLLAADSIFKDLDKHFNYKESNYKLNLVNTSLLQHKFIEADSFLQQAKKIGIGAYEAAANTFDIQFELGNYLYAQSELKKIKNYSDYNFLFRNAKLHHYKNDIDSAIANMQAAAKIAGENRGLKTAALSNAADLLLHNGNALKAYETYTTCVNLNATDYHSILGLANIALLHDKNGSAAQILYALLEKNTKEPIIRYKQMQAYLLLGDKTLAKEKANEFLSIAGNRLYGNMYNKYLLDATTSTLQLPNKAIEIAESEVKARATAQTYAWQVWAYSNANKLEAANTVYTKYVSGKPLEATELFWMGKYMQGNNKTYNANQFFKSALENKYDLSVAALQELEEL
jgi:hypothetical protein